MIFLFILALLCLTFRWVRALVLVITVAVLLAGTFALVVTADVSHHATYR